MRPATGVSRRTMQRASVDLPQPDSPTIPTVSPRATVKLTLFRARTIWIGCPVSRATKERWRRKLIDRFSTAIRGSASVIDASRCSNDFMADAGRSVDRLDSDQRRARLPAGIDHEAAARRKGATLRQFQEQRGLAGDRGERLAHHAGAWHGIEQAEGIGVARLAEDLRHRTRLHHATGIHDR